MNRTTFRTLSTLSLAAVITLAAQAATPIDKASTALTDQQVQVLVSNAKTPADHARIAGYYRAKAEAYTAEAQVHARMLADYKADATKVSSKNYAMTIGHCQSLVRDLEQKAAAAQKQAETHEQAAGITPPAPAHDMSTMKMDGHSHNCCPGNK